MWSENVSKNNMLHNIFSRLSRPTITNEILTKSTILNGYFLMFITEKVGFIISSGIKYVTLIAKTAESDSREIEISLSTYFLK